MTSSERIRVDAVVERAEGRIATPARSRQRDLDLFLQRRPGAGAHDADAVGQDDGLADVVGDEQHRARGALLDGRQLVLQDRPRLCIERGEGLVHEQDRALADQRAGDLDALLHAARELRGELVALLAQPDEVELLQRLAAPFGRRHAGELQAELDVLLRRQPAIERIVALEDHDPVDAGRGDRAAADRERPAMQRARSRRAGSARWSCRSPRDRAGRRTRPASIGRLRLLKDPVGRIQAGIVPEVDLVEVDVGSGHSRQPRSRCGTARTCARCRGSRPRSRTCRGCRS